MAEKRSCLGGSSSTGAVAICHAWLGDFVPEVQYLKGVNKFAARVFTDGTTNVPPPLLVRARYEKQRTGPHEWWFTVTRGERRSGDWLFY